MTDNLVKRLRDWWLVYPEDEDKDVGHLYEEAADRIEELEAEIETLTTAGIVEVAARNPNVMEYMRHWEGRAEKAEAEVARLRGALTEIERLYYMEGRETRWRAAHMCGEATRALAQTSTKEGEE